MSDEPLPMMQGKFEELKKMSRKQMAIEIEAWRNLWSYVPSEVKGCQQAVQSHGRSLGNPSLSCSCMLADSPLYTIY